jgi:hypothetical protein
LTSAPVLSWRTGHEACHFLANGNWQRKVGHAGGAVWLMAGFARLVAHDRHPFVVGRAGERGGGRLSRLVVGSTGFRPGFAGPCGLVHCSIRGTLVRQGLFPRSSPDLERCQTIFVVVTVDCSVQLSAPRCVQPSSRRLTQTAAQPGRSPNAARRPVTDRSAPSVAGGAFLSAF